MLEVAHQMKAERRLEEGSRRKMFMTTPVVWKDVTRENVGFGGGGFVDEEGGVVGEVGEEEEEGEGEGGEEEGNVRRIRMNSIRRLSSCLKPKRQNVSDKEYLTNKKERERTTHPRF